jgi:signal transduction histidine kinase
VVDYATDRSRVGARVPLDSATLGGLSAGAPAQAQREASKRDVGPGPQTLAVPLVVRGESVGIIELQRAGAPFSNGDIDAVRRLAPMAALLARNARLLEEARQASRAKSEFLNMAGHELRTPLAVIRGYLSLISSGAYGDSPVKWSSAVKVLEDKSTELTTMVESILIAARMQAGRLQLSLDAVDLAQVVKQAVERGKALAAMTGGAVAGRYPAEPVKVRADEQQLVVILDNLLANAIRYSPPPADVSVSLTVSTHMAEVRVADRGRGIPRDEWERIFGEFERIESFDPGYPSGTGLGLYIARQLSERYGGTLVLESSEPGHGSTFVLRLPTAQVTS